MNYIDIQIEREDIQELFEKCLEKTSIPKFLEFRVMGNNKLKILGKIVKSNDLVEKISDGVNFVVVVNVELFDQLPPDMQELFFNEILVGVQVDPNTDKIGYVKPDITTYSSLLRIYSSDVIIRFKESVKSIVDAKLQKERDEKQAKKEKKKKKF